MSILGKILRLVLRRPIPLKKGATYAERLEHILSEHPQEAKAVGLEHLRVDSGYPSSICFICQAREQGD